jgi:Chaperone of endosialidase
MNNTNLFTNPIHRWPSRRGVLVAFAGGMFALSSIVHAVDPPPNGGYPNDTTALGQDALFSLTAGDNNTAIGFDALYDTTTGYYNTAVGSFALTNNSTGFYNTALGMTALYYNTTGEANTALGTFALIFNTGSFNTAVGDDALFSNTTGINNTGVGEGSLYYNVSGSNNIALGESAGTAITGSNNIDIGNTGVADESGIIRIGTQGTQTATFIAGIAGVPLGVARSIGVTADGQLGVKPSSARYKEAIQPMNKSSEALLNLKPVTFRYKKELDPKRVRQFGLVAEEVAKVDPDLVDLDAKGKPFTVRYDEVNAMLLNEFIKEHQKVQRLEASLAAVNERLKAQDAKIDKVNAKVELTKPAPQMVVNEQ